MSNANRDYVVICDVKNSKLTIYRPIKFYVTDKNTSNIFIRLVTKIENDSGVDEYVDLEPANNFVVTIRIIKPDDEVKSIVASKLQEGTIYQVDLQEDCKDIPGTYKCELLISTIVYGRQELNTSDMFTYKVENSILSRAEVIETKGITTEYLLNRVDAASSQASAIGLQMDKVSLQISQIEKLCKSKVNDISKLKSCVTIIFDDISTGDYFTLFPILKEKNMRIGQSCITDWVGTYNKNTHFATWEQIKEMSDWGNEILSHSIRQDVKYTDLTDVELDNYFKQSRDTLREHGHYSDILVYTWGSSDERIRRFARKYYKAGFAIFGSEKVKHSNGATINTYDIARVGLNGEDSPQSLFPSDTSSLDYLKARVDYAKANNQWLVFMGHTFMFGNSDQAKINQFKDLIDYIKSVGLDIVTPTEGLERMGNVIDLVANEDETKYFKLNSKGQIKSNLFDVWDCDTYTGSDTSVAFRNGISVTSISTTKAQDDSHLPSDIGGTLVTYNPINGDLGFQEYITAYGHRYQRWVQDANGNFSEWLNILPPKLYNTTITVPSIEIPAKTSYNYSFSAAEALTNVNNISLYPTSNIENGLIFSHWIMPDKTVIIRFSNFTDAPIVTTAREWKLTSIQLRS